MLSRTAIRTLHRFGSTQFVEQSQMNSSLQLELSQPIRATGGEIGMVGAWLVTRAMAAILFQVDPHDVATFLAVPLLIGVSVAIATIIPTRRAMLANPSEVMRME